MGDDKSIKARERFILETAEHRMSVLHDDGLYRHVRFQQPGTSFYWFDLITWPGNLAVTGDCGTFSFARITDMFEFFAGETKRGFDDERWGINPGYWKQKLRAPDSRAVQVYSEDAYRAHVIEWFEDVSDGMNVDETFLLRLAVSEQLLLDPWREDLSHEEGARRRLNDFEHRHIRIFDTWEWEMWEYDWQFLWCCWAIVWGIEQYRAAACSNAPVEAGAVAEVSGV